MKKSTIVLIIIFLSAVNLFAQEDLQLGRSNFTSSYYHGAFYDFSDPSTLNMKIAVWGYVSYPGRYIIPAFSDVRDLISYAGGPTVDADLDELKLYRKSDDSTSVVLNLDFKDIIWDSGVKFTKSMFPLKAGDILVVPGNPRLFFRDYFLMTTSIISTLISIVLLILYFD
ncbi:SLBB domain-containing protein [Bacteroidota bacterium]